MQFTEDQCGVVAITGAGSGIGQACAVAFCRSGCTSFALMDRNLIGLEDTKQLLVAVQSDADIMLVGLDITSEAEVTKAINTIQEHFKRIDYVVQCAGLNQQPRAPLHETEMVNFDKVVNVNYRGLYMVQRECVRKMLLQDRRGKYGARGSIVNISSVAAYKGIPNLTPYASSKAAVVSLTKTDAAGYAKEGIRINCICPGVVLIPMNASSRLAGDNFSYLETVPSGRAAQPEEIAWTALFLSHPNSDYFVGAALIVDGGMNVV